MNDRTREQTNADKKAPIPIRWLWERPIVVTASWVALLIADATDRWPVSYPDVLMWVILTAPIAYVLLRRQHVRQQYEDSRRLLSRGRVPVRSGIRGIGDRLLNLDLAFSRWPWAQPVAAAGTATVVSLVFLALHAGGDVSLNVVLTVAIGSGAAATSYIGWWFVRHR